MNTVFTYSILQYKHSIIIREAINVGILFYFPTEEKVLFVSGNSTRVKAIYPDFDQLFFNHLIKDFERKIKTFYTNNLYKDFHSANGIQKFINNNLLLEDSTSLQFTDPAKIINTFDGYRAAADYYSKLLLPGIDERKYDISKHDEHFIIKRFTNYLSEKTKNIDNLISRNIEIRVDGAKLKFDISWHDGTTNLVKPISFDLVKKQDIQNKYVLFNGYLNIFEEYVKRNKMRFDLLVAKPQNPDLHKDYLNAIDYLNRGKSPKRIIKDDELKDYSEETIDYLLKEQSN